MSIKLLDVRTLHEGFGKLVVGRFRLADGVEIVREISDQGDSVAMLAYDPDRRIAILTRQFRAPVFYAEQESFLLEAPAGRIEDDGPAKSGRRELIEEIGIDASQIEHIATTWSSPGVSTERLHLFLAAFSEADRVGDGGGLAEENEHIEPVTVPLSELAGMAERGEIADLKTLALVLALQLRRPELFRTSTQR
ncbi:MAG TPA: NUDIX hydrolase [Saliniramus sp.]|nr:NUDIX hydrolase [Saliniramus sp.]